MQASFVENSHGRHDDDFYRTPPEVTPPCAMNSFFVDFAEHNP